jgi:hypothetical protein
MRLRLHLQLHLLQHQLKIRHQPPQLQLVSLCKSNYALAKLVESQNKILQNFLLALKMTTPQEQDNKCRFENLLVLQNAGYVSALQTIQIAYVAMRIL